MCAEPGAQVEICQQVGRTDYSGVVVVHQTHSGVVVVHQTHKSPPPPPRPTNALPNEHSVTTVLFWDPINQVPGFRTEVSG